VLVVHPSPAIAVERRIIKPCHASHSNRSPGRRPPLSTSDLPHLRRTQARAQHVRGLGGCWRWAQLLDMMSFTDLASVPSDPLVPFTDQLRLAMAAHLARFKGSSRPHRVRPTLFHQMVHRARAPSAAWTLRPTACPGHSAACCRVVQLREVCLALHGGGVRSDVRSLSGLCR
jgi:hypothetical protein